VLLATSNTPINTWAMIHDIMKIEIPGKMRPYEPPSLGHTLRIAIPIIVVRTEIENFARNMKALASPSTNENFAAFLRINRKA